MRSASTDWKVPGTGTLAMLRYIFMGRLDDESLSVDSVIVTIGERPQILIHDKIFKRGRPEPAKTGLGSEDYPEDIRGEMTVGVTKSRTGIKSDTVDGRKGKSKYPTNIPALLEECDIPVFNYYSVESLAKAWNSTAASIRQYAHGGRFFDPEYGKDAVFYTLGSKPILLFSEKVLEVGKPKQLPNGLGSPNYPQDVLKKIRAKAY